MDSAAVARIDIINLNNPEVDLKNMRTSGPDTIVAKDTGRIDRVVAVYSTAILPPRLRVSKVSISPLRDLH